MLKVEICRTTISMHLLCIKILCQIRNRLLISRCQVSIVESSITGKELESFRIEDTISLFPLFSYAGFSN